MGLFDTLRSVFGKRTDPAAPAPAPTSAGEAVGVPGPLVEKRQCARRNPREGTRILLIDDSATILAVLRKTLTSAGCITDEATDGESGLAQARAQRPDLIILDIVMPGMTGFAVLRVLRRDEALRDIPVIMISGNEQAVEQFFGTRIGADDFMKKPFARHEIFTRIERLLDDEGTPRRASEPAPQ